MCFFFFFFNDTATTEIYTLSLHDALPIFTGKTMHISTAATIAAVVTERHFMFASLGRSLTSPRDCRSGSCGRHRSEEHTSELQSLAYLVCRLLLEKKKNTINKLRLQSVHL